MPHPQDHTEDKITSRIQEWRPPFETDIASAKARVMRRIRFDDKKAEKVKNRKYSRILFRVAIALFIFVACGALLAVLSHKVYLNSSGMSKIVTLPDGSEAMLTPHSELSYNSLFWHFRRRVFFKGEGYFSITSGDDFVIGTPKGAVSVLGTKFTVWADTNDLFVHCTIGKVQVQHNDQKAILKANEFIQLIDGQLSHQMVFKSVGFIAPRKSNLITFDSVPVGIVLSELEIILDIEIKNQLPANLIYTGMLDVRDANQCFAVFCKPFGAKFDIKPDGNVSIHL